MNLPSKLIPLQRRCAANQLRCEVQIALHQKNLRALENELSGIALKIKASLELLQTQKIQNSTLNRAEFFALLRKQSKLRRQIQQLHLQHTTLQEKHAEITQQKEQAWQERVFWIRKQDKFQHWIEADKRKTRLERLLREENDIQEMTTWLT